MADAPHVQIKQQNRKSIAMRINRAGDVIVMIPYWMKPNNRIVKRFIKEGLKKLDSLIPDEKPVLLHSESSIRQLVYKWAESMGLEIGRVQFREMSRKWGSCSSKGNITLNTALCYIPYHLMEYVVVHELVHLIVFDHSPQFWAKLGEYLPDYADCESELNTYHV